MWPERNFQGIRIKLISARTDRLDRGGTALAQKINVNIILCKCCLSLMSAKP